MISTLTKLTDAQKVLVACLTVFGLVLIMVYILRPFFLLHLNEVQEGCLSSAICFNREMSKIGVLQYLPFVHYISGIGCGTAIVGLCLLALQNKKIVSLKRIFIIIVVCQIITLAVLISGFAMARAYDKGMGTTFQCSSESFEDCIDEHRRSLGILNHSVEIIRVGIVGTGVSLVYVIVSGSALVFYRLYRRVQPQVV